MGMENDFNYLGWADPEIPDDQCLEMSQECRPDYMQYEEYETAVEFGKMRGFALEEGRMLVYR